MLEPLIPPLLIALLGAGAFLRLVAKEKHRRERHLQFRLDEQIRIIEEEKELARKKAAEEGLADEDLEATPVDGEDIPVEAVQQLATSHAGGDNGTRR